MGRYNLQLAHFPNPLILVDFVLTLPLTMADCEKLVETEHHASLVPSASDDLMMVYLNSPAIKIFPLNCNLVDGCESNHAQFPSR